MTRLERHALDGAWTGPIRHCEFTNQPRKVAPQLMTRSSPSVTAFHLLQLVIFTFVFGVPTALIAGLYTWADGSWIRFLVLVVAAPVWLATYALACGVASLPFTSAVKPGTFPRDLADAAYRGRRLYGLCWTCLYYLSAAYHLVLAFPVLKWAVFRLFG